MALPDDGWLREEAGDGAFKRGVGYFKDGAVVLARQSEDALEGEAHGSETYRLWFKRGGSDWDWNCTCPAADGGALCKHLVAAVLTARDGDAEQASASAPRPARGRKQSAVTEQDLRAFLCAQPSERLADWLLEFARFDRGIEKHLKLQLAATQPAALQQALSGLLTAGGFMDYRRTLDYARRLRAGIDLLNDALQRDPVECRALCEYSLKRLFKLIERVDDSAGALGDCMAEIADIHAQACDAAAPGKALVKPLLALQAQDEWRLLPIARYWEALGAAGQAAYAKQVIAAFEQLPPVKPGGWDSEGFYVCDRAEALARCMGDFDLLQRVLRRDLSNPRQHLRVLESLHAFGRAREALVFAEAAVKRFPKEASLREALARCLTEAGLTEEAMEQQWAAFVQQPGEHTWDALKHSAGAAWPQWREKALSHATEPANQPADLRIVLLTHDGAIADAIALARSKPVVQFPLHLLADAARRVDKDAAAEFYLRLARPCAERLHGPSQYKTMVDLLSLSAKCAQTDALQAFVTEIRTGHARKTKLMAMLTEAGL